MQYYGIVLGAVSLSISILLVISLILTMCLCCHPVTSEKIDNEPDFRNKLLNRLSAYYNSNENWFNFINCVYYKNVSSI